MQCIGGVAIQARHRSCCGSNPGFLGEALLQCGRDHSGSNWLGKQENISRLCADILPYFLGMDYAGDSVAKLQLVIANGMSADNRAICLRHFCEATAQNLFENLRRA